MNQFSHKLIVKDPFEMPAVDDTTVLVLRECVDLVPNCWIWNESVGYLEVVKYSGYDIYITVKNVGMKENATSGTIFPSCMEFLITAPNATPIIDNTVTCLRADFKCPTVGQEALMSVDSTSAIRTGDLIIVDTRYQYLVTEIINEHTMKVLNEEKGKEGGIIDVKCNECVPVKIFESTHCCEALQEQVDDIYNRIDTKKSVVSNNALLSVDHGLDAISDVSYNIELDIDTDLSKYDNTSSQFITQSDIPTVNDATLKIYNSDGVTPFIEFSANAATAVTATLPASGTTLVYFKELYDTALTTARFVPNTNSVATSYSLGNTNNWINDSYIENTRVKTLIGQNYVDGITYDSNIGVDHPVIYDAGTTSANYGQHRFNSGGNNIFNIGRDSVTTTVDLLPINPGTGFPNLGSNDNKWSNAYINNLYANNIGNYVAVFKSGSTITNTIPIGSNLPANTPYNNWSNTVTFTNSFPQPVTIIGFGNINRFRVQVATGVGNHIAYENFLWWYYSIDGGTEQEYQGFTDYTVTPPNSSSYKTEYNLSATIFASINLPAGSSITLRWRHRFSLPEITGTANVVSGWGPDYTLLWYGFLTS